MPEETVGVADTITCQCRVCVKKRGLGVVPNGTIHSYSAQPRGGWRVRRTTAEQGAATTAPTFGVELETTLTPREHFRMLPYTGPGMPSRWDYLTGDGLRFDEPAFSAAMQAFTATRDVWREHNRVAQERFDRENRSADSLTGDEAAGLAAPRGLWLPCHDGSVSGPEFKSQPATLAFWRAQRPAIERMFRELLHGGVRSHDGDKAGMHINIGVDAFTDASHLERFAALVVANPRWATRMAQRTHESVSHWSPFAGPCMTMPERHSWAVAAFTNRPQYQDRYSVLNAGNPGRIEFRLPRGTLRIDRFYAKLEWVASMIEYTRDAENPVRVPDYVAWVTDNTPSYPECVAMMRERFPHRFDEPVTAGAVTA